MADVFLERFFDPPIKHADLVDMLDVSGTRGDGCGIEWRESYVDRTRRRLLCRFEAPDRSRIYERYRNGRASIRAVWEGASHEAAVEQGVTARAGDAHVLGQRSFAEPMSLGELRALERVCRWCSMEFRIRLSRTFLSFDRKRIVYLYTAPDAESVRQAHRNAGLELDVVWPYRRISGTSVSVREQYGPEVAVSDAGLS